MATKRRVVGVASSAQLDFPPRSAGSLRWTRFTAQQPSFEHPWLARDCSPMQDDLRFKKSSSSRMAAARKASHALAANTVHAIRPGSVIQPIPGSVLFYPSIKRRTDCLEIGDAKARRKRRFSAKCLLTSDYVFAERAAALTGRSCSQRRGSGLCRRVKIPGSDWRATFAAAARRSAAA